MKFKYFLILILFMLIGCQCRQVSDINVNNANKQYSERLEATMLAGLIKEFDKKLKHDSNKAALQKAIAVILATRTENVFREDDLHYLMYELRVRMIEETDLEEKRILSQIYDREQEWMRQRRNATNQ